jgi:hypothetical protein
LPKGRDGKPLGKAVEIEYDVVDLPAWDFGKLVGGAVLRLTLGMLHKMTGGNLDEYSEALKPLSEIADMGQRIELTKELFDLVDKAFKANNRRLDAAKVNEALKPLFQEKERTIMIKSCFDEKYDAGVADGETRAWRKAVLTAIRTKFSRVPKGIEKTVQAMSDPIALESLVVRVGQCKTLDEFATDL